MVVSRQCLQRDVGVALGVGQEVGAGGDDDVALAPDVGVLEGLRQPVRVGGVADGGGR